MPFPQDNVRGAEVLSALPNAGQGVSEVEADERVLRWAAMLEYAPVSAREIALASQVVATGAEANLFRLQLRRSGYVETPDADSLREEAKALLEAYNGMKTTEGEEPSGARIEPLPW